MDFFGYHLPSLIGVGATFGAVYGAFAKFDSDQTDDNRKFVRDWLAGLKVKQRWNKVIEELFTKFFGSKHLSWKCLRRSLALSAGLIIAVWLLWELEREFEQGHFFGWRPWAFVLLVSQSFLYGGIADFLSLWKTRYLLTRLSSFSSGFAIVATVAGDFVATTLIFFALSFVALVSFAQFGFADICYSNGGVRAVLECVGSISLSENAEHVLRTLTPIVFDRRALPLSFLYFVALLTSAWLWVYLIVAYGMRAVSRLPSWLRILSKVTDYENHPVRSIGYVAATVSAVIVAIVTLI